MAMFLLLPSAVVVIVEQPGDNPPSERANIPAAAK
jgi:hypothetical protein